MTPKINNSQFSEIVRLYREENLSQAEIGSRFGVSGQCISYYLRKLDVETRVGTSKLPRTQVEEQKQIAKLLYDAGASIYEIASILKLTPQTTHEHLETLGYKPRERKEYGRKAKNNAIRAEVLFNLWQQGLDISKIGEIIGVSTNQVRQRLKKFPQYVPSKRKTAKEGEQELVAKVSSLAQEGKSRRDIATALGISYDVLCRICKTYGIPVRHAHFREELSGKIFGYWKVLSPLGYKLKDGTYTYHCAPATDSSYYWECLCLRCEKTIRPISAGNLRKGYSKSCRSCSAKNRHERKSAKTKND